MASFEHSQGGARRDEPLLHRGERPLLRRSDIHMTASGPGLPKSKAKSTGTVFLTTQRLVFMPKKASDPQMDIELGGISAEKFNQPIFGANSISGTASSCSFMANGISHPTSMVKWKFAFFSGGVGTFLNVFLRILAFVRQDNPENIAVAQASYVATQAVVEQLVGPAAPMDASDPSEVWVSDAYVVDTVTVTDPAYDAGAAGVQYATPVTAEPVEQNGEAVATAAVDAPSVRPAGAAAEVTDHDGDELDSIVRLANDADAQMRNTREGRRARQDQEYSDRANTALAGEVAVTAMILGPM